MIKEFLQNWQAKKAVRDFLKSSLGKALHNHTEQYFNLPRLSCLSEDFKIKTIEDFSRRIVGLSQAENPLLAMREALAGYSIEYIRFHLLALNEEDKKVHYGEDCTEISGQLFNYIDYSGPGFLGQRNEVNFLFKETANGKECSCQSRCSGRRA